MSKLYYRKNGFLLSDGENNFSISEPIKWDAVRLNIEFDNEFFGFRYEFSDKDVVLEFDEAAGYSIIKEQYLKLGADMVCMLKFGYYEGNVFTVLYEGQLVGETYDENKYTIKCTVEKRSFRQKFLSRYDMPVDIFSPTSIDEVILPPLERKKVVLNPLALKQVANMIYNTNVSQSVTTEYEEPASDPGPTELFTFIPPFKIVNSNIAELAEPFPTDGTLYYSGFEFENGITQKVINIKRLKLRFAFNYAVASSAEPNIQFGVTLFKKSNISTGPNNGDIDFPFTDGENVIRINTIVPNAVGVKVCIVDISNLQFKLAPDEAIFIKCYSITYDGGTVNSRIFINPDTWLLEIEQEAYTAATQNDAVYIHEGLERVLEIITDSKILKSNFIGRTDIGYAENGEQSDNFIMNGKMIRGLQETFAQSAKNIIMPLINLYGLGLTFEKNEDGDEFLRLEKVEEFFKDVELYNFTTVSKYSRTFGKELTFNELEFGFEKYPRDSQQNSFSEYLTKMFWATPIKFFKNKFSKLVSALLASTYFEYTRQQAFSNEPDTAYETDDNLFILKVDSTNGVYLDAEIRFTADEIYVKRNSGTSPIPFLVGDQFVVTGHPTIANNKIYTIVSVRYLYTPGFSLDGGFGYLIEVAEGYTINNSQEDCAITLQILEPGGIRYMPKLNRTFSLGMSVYNSYYRISNSLKAWAKIFNSGLRGYFNSGLIKFLSGFSNTSLDNVNYELPDYKNGETGELDKPLFTGDIIKFQTQIDWEVYNLLVKAYEGRHPENKNYGYFRFTNPDGIEEKAFANKLSFDPTTQILTLTLWEKFND